MGEIDACCPVLSLAVGHYHRCTPADPANPTPGELSAIQAFEICSAVCIHEIMFRVDSTVKAVIGDLEDPKLIWELLE